MYEKIKKRFWLFWIVIVVVLLILLTKNLEAQIFLPIHQEPVEDDYGFIVDHPFLNYDVYLNGIELKFNDVPVAFIYGNEPFGFMDDRFQIVLITGEIIEIRLRGK